MTAPVTPIDDNVGVRRSPKYLVRVDDNARYMDDEARWTYGEFDTAEAALAACRHIVDLCLEEAYQPGMTVEELAASYRMFGDDPFVVPLDGMPRVEFSAWAYARQRAEDMCRGPRQAQ